MSESSLAWMPTASSGVTRRRVPSYGETNVAASSSTVGDLAQADQLEAAAVGEDGAVPAHECVQAAGALDEVDARSQREVVRVAEQDVGAACAHLVRVERLDRGVGAHRHEGGRPHLAVGGAQAAGARRSVPGIDGERAHDREPSRQQSMQSPKLRNR